jgi:hypothetical protein
LLSFFFHYRGFRVTVQKNRWDDARDTSDLKICGLFSGFKNSAPTPAGIETKSNTLTIDDNGGFGILQVCHHRLLLLVLVVLDLMNWNQESTSDSLETQYQVDS